MDTLQVPIDTGIATIVFTDATDGDFQIDTPASSLQQLRRSVVDLPWVWFKQVHGDQVQVVSSPGEHAGLEADGSVTGEKNTPLSVTTADCAPVVLVGSSAIAVLHAGWRSLEAGIIQRGADALAALGAEPRKTVLGPHISASKYMFGAADLDRLSAEFGQSIIGSTDAGEQALDMYAGVSVACNRAGWPVPEVAPCTSGEQWFSHRVRKDVGRQATVAWISDA